MLIKLNIYFVCLKLLMLSTYSSQTNVGVNTSVNIDNRSAIWTQFDNRFLYYISNSSEDTDWRNAETICRHKNSHLVSIHNNIENRFLAILTKRYRKQFWIGLSQSTSDSNSYVWSDRTANTYRDFQYFSLNNSVLNANVFYESCVTIESGSGVWKYNSCNESRFGFICAKSQLASHATKQTNYVSKIYNRNKTVKTLLDYCKSSGLALGECMQYNNNYYLFVSQLHLNWIEAQSVCQKFSGFNLVSILDSEEHTFISKYAKSHLNSSQFSIGLYGLTNATQLRFQWIDKSSVDSTFWATKQPIINNHDEICTFQDISSGNWRVGTCNETKQTFICKSVSDKNANSGSVSYSHYYCPSYNLTSDLLNAAFKWINVDKSFEYCYWFSADFDPNLLKTTWNEASMKCRSINATLVSIHSNQDLMKLKTKLFANIWIGLYKSENGYFHWEDNSAIDYKNWDYIRNTSNQEKQCFIIEPGSLKWIQRDCFNNSSIYNYICQARKTPNKSEPDFSTTIAKSGDTTTTTQMTNSTPFSQHLESAIEDSGLPEALEIGISVLTLLILISVAVGVYYFSKKYRIRNRVSNASSEVNSEQTYSSSAGSVDSRRRYNDVLNSSDPNVVFSNIRLHK